jgi:hypothetical protein
MNAGSIYGKGQPAHLYSLLKAHPGPHGGWALAMALQTTAISTVVAAVRQQLPEGERLTHTMTVDSGRRRNYYTLETV